MRVIIELELKRKDVLTLQSKHLDFKDGKIEYFIGNFKNPICINPTDLELPSRLKEARDNIGKRLLKYKAAAGLKINEKEEKQFKLLRDVSVYVNEQIDYAFNEQISKKLFGSASPLSINEDSKFYIEELLNVLYPEIEKVFDERLKSTNERLKLNSNKKANGSN